MTDTPRLDEAQRRAWEGYRQLRLRLDARVARDLEDDSGLTVPDYEVLSSVAAVEEGCIRVVGLADRMGWSRSRLSRQLGRMERRGLIGREPCELDGRGDDVVLTEAGRRAVEQAAPGHLRSVRAHFLDPLSAAQLAALTDIVDTVLGQADRHPS